MKFRMDLYGRCPEHFKQVQESVYNFAFKETDEFFPLAPKNLFGICVCKCINENLFTDLLWAAWDLHLNQRFTKVKAITLQVCWGLCEMGTIEKSHSPDGCGGTVQKMRIPDPEEAVFLLPVSRKPLWCRCEINTKTYLIVLPLGKLWVPAATLKRWWGAREDSSKYQILSLLPGVVF